MDNFVTTELDALDVLVALGAFEVFAGLGEEWDDGRTGVATDDHDVLIGWVGALEGGDETGSADNIKGGDTEEFLGVVDAGGFEDFGSDWDCRVDL